MFSIGYFKKQIAFLILQMIINKNVATLVLFLNLMSRLLAENQPVEKYSEINNLLIQDMGM